MQAEGMPSGLITAVVLASLLALSSADKPNLVQPNLVFIREFARFTWFDCHDSVCALSVADDLGYNMIGFKNNITISPNIDGLFTGGLELKQYYAHKWCAPTRAALMTGRLPYHTGIEHGSLGNYAAKEQYLGLHRNYSFMPRTLKDAGYHTHMLGKWNLGFWHEELTPVGRGFDSYLGYLSPDEQYFTHFKWPPYSGGKNSPTNYNASLPKIPYITDLTNGTGPALVNPYNGTYSTFMYQTEAIAVIEQEAAAQLEATTAGMAPSPFFLYLAVQSIHTPLEAPQSYMDLYEGKVPGAANHSDAQITMAMVTALDDLVGNVTDALKKHSLWQSTLVVFTSDNGGDTHGNNFPLRSGKFTVYEGGMRVITTVSGGYLPAKCHGRGSDNLMHVADWHPVSSMRLSFRVEVLLKRSLCTILDWPLTAVSLSALGSYPNRHSQRWLGCRQRN
jgi:arylsulfatase A-like enzyme